MDSDNLFINNEIDDWAMPYFRKIIVELTESNGSISQVKKTGLFIEIMSKVKDSIRYDKISKDSVVTYSLPNKFDLMIKSSKLLVL